MNSWSVQQFFCLFLLLLTISNHTDGEVFFFYWHLLRQDDKYKRKKNFTQIMQNVYRVSATEWSRLEWATPKRTPSCRQAGGSNSVTVIVNNCGVKSGGGEAEPCGKCRREGGLATVWKFLGVKVFKSPAKAPSLGKLSSSFTTATVCFSSSCSSALSFTPPSTSLSWMTLFDPHLAKHPGERRAVLIVFECKHLDPWPHRSPSPRPPCS